MSYLQAVLSNNLSVDKISACTSDLQLEGKADEKEVICTKVVKNAHTDDIHGFVSISDKNFVSGSKDNNLKIWSVSGDLIKTLAPKVFSGYEYWVTALTRFSNGYWASGTRQGNITVWTKEGQRKVSMQYSPSIRSTRRYVCKERNKLRINCITELETNKTTTYFYTGTARFVQLWDAKNQKLIQYYEASKNDWVYCIEVLENKDLIVVIGSDLELWNMRGRDKFIKKRSKLIKEDIAEYRYCQRPHISTIVRLEFDRNLLVAAVFDGSVRLVNMQAQREVKSFTEHQGRVWSVINLKDTLFASSADDKTIKIWDSRKEHSIFTLKGNPGRVSSMLRIDENTFISGSCPDNIEDSSEKACIRFWDMRRL